MACLCVVAGGEEREFMEYRAVLHNGESRASPCDRLRFFFGSHISRIPGPMTTVGLPLLLALLRVVGDLTCGTLCCLSSCCSCFFCLDPGPWIPEVSSRPKKRFFSGASTVAPAPHTKETPATRGVDEEEAAGRQQSEARSLRRVVSKVKKNFDAA